MTATLPSEVQTVFERFVSTELTTIDELGRPITWAVTPRYRAGAPCIDVSTDRAVQTRRNSHVGLLFCDAAGSGLDEAPIVLVQGTADAAGEREIHVRPERVYVWPPGRPDAEPVLYDAHMEEVRSGHSEEPEVLHTPPEGGPSAWDARLEPLAGADATAILAVVSPDGFPFAARVRVALDAAARWVEVVDAPAGLPLEPGRACLATDEPDALQVRGDLVLVANGWALVPHSIRTGRSAHGPTES